MIQKRKIVIISIVLLIVCSFFIYWFVFKYKHSVPKTPHRPIPYGPIPYGPPKPPRPGPPKPIDNSGNWTNYQKTVYFNNKAQIRDIQDLDFEDICNENIDLAHTAEKCIVDILSANYSYDQVMNADFHPDPSLFVKCNEICMGTKKAWSKEMKQSFRDALMQTSDDIEGSGLSRDKTQCIVDKLEQQYDPVYIQKLFNNNDVNDIFRPIVKICSK